MSSILPLRCQACSFVLRSGGAECPLRDSKKSAGSVLITEGQEPTHVLFVRRGQVVLSSTSVSGSEVSCAVRGPNTMIGLEALLGRPVPYQVWALTDVAICSLEVDGFRAWLGSAATPLGATLNYSLEEAARRVGERHALEGTALRRVARFLLEHAENDSGGESLDTPHRLLAGILGMRPETLSRTLGELRDAGALAKGRNVRVASVDRLRAIASD